MTYLIEPYNAYQKPAKKKHPTEYAEEEALFVRTMIQEQARNAELQRMMMAEATKQHLSLREAAAQKNLTNQNLALPQYTPQPASQQVQDGQFAAPSGGGPSVAYAITSTTLAVPTYLIVTFTSSSIGFGGVPGSNMEPVTMSFSPLVAYDGGGTLTYNWYFGNGTSSLNADGLVVATAYYTSIGPVTASLQVTESVVGMTGSFSTQFYIDS